MKSENACDVAVIGAGHAGIEAALAAAKLGADVILFTLSLDSLANMPCNPSIGGTGKGHLVFEIDALGGVMGKIADDTMLQCRMLNVSKGAAVQSLRFQADRSVYHAKMKSLIEHTPGIRLIQAEIAGLIVQNAGGTRSVKGVRSKTGLEYSAETVVICTGTYLDSDIITGDSRIPAGPDNSCRSEGLSENLSELGIKLMRFKTGTPPRVHADTIDYSKLEYQPGDDEIVRFSADTPEPYFAKTEQLACHIAYTTAETHRIIRDNLHKSPMYSGKIKGTGARYCPSIEDKIVRFTDKERHQLFIEPMGRDTKEMYIQGFSTSMPPDVQNQMLRSIPGLERAQIMRYAYAIEYNCCDPTQLRHTLEFRELHGLYGAGQFNGTSGYEEAAAQGLIAGINAALSVKGRSPLVLDRASSYIGMLIDDLVVKGTEEPYRVMTSRTEYRLLLRQDNAGERLSETAYGIGMISEKRRMDVLSESKAVRDEINRVKELVIPPSEEVNALLAENGSAPIATGIRYIDLLRRPELNYNNTALIDADRPHTGKRIFDRAYTEIRYEGYIKRQYAEVEKHRRLENYKIPEDIDYKALKGLRLEAIAKLERFRPENIGQASRISGISPADITVLLIILGK